MNPTMTMPLPFRITFFIILLQDRSRSDGHSLCPNFMSSKPQALDLRTEAMSHKPNPFITPRVFKYEAQKALPLSRIVGAGGS